METTLKRNKKYLADSAATGDFVLTGADIVGPSEIYHNEALVVRDGRIDSISPETLPGNILHYDVTGLLLLPGIIDLHSDALERALEPRPGVLLPIKEALHDFDLRLPPVGITTAYHCVAFAAEEPGKRSLRSMKNAETIIDQIIEQRSDLVTRTMIHLRYDILNRKALPAVMERLQREEVQLVSLMDHTPGQGQFSDIEDYKKMLKDSDYGDNASDKIIDKRLKLRSLVQDEELRMIGDMALSREIPMASHDDDSAGKVGWAMDLGARIAEFPVNWEAVKASSLEQRPVILGGPNLVRGGSYTGNISAKEAISHGYGDILCSDYVPSSLLHSLFLLADMEGFSLVEAARFVSMNPARAAGIEGYTGSIEVGKEADLLLIDPLTPIPRLIRTWIRGEMVYGIGGMPFSADL